MKFIEWCLSHRILLAVYPPHSTHRLQPLDVSLFSPLAVRYSQQLNQFMNDCQGISSISKRDFFRLFWPAFNDAFTVKNVMSGWQRTGLIPLDRGAVMKIFKEKQITLPQPQSLNSSRPTTANSSTSVLSAKDWRRIESMLKNVVIGVLNDEQAADLRKLNRTIDSITTENHLLKAENRGLKNGLANEKKKRKRNKGLFEKVRQQDGHGATFFSPAKIQQAKVVLQEQEVAKAEQVKQKQTKQQARKDQAAIRRQEIEERKVAAAAKRRQKQNDKEVLQASRQLQQSLQASAKKPIKRSLIVKLPLPREFEFEHPKKLDWLHKPDLPPSRTRRAPLYVRLQELDT